MVLYSETLLEWLYVPYLHFSSSCLCVDLQTQICACTRGLPSTLVSSVKLGATASCKTCGGRPIFDGKGSVSTSMMSRVGLELTNFINPDLTWKTVSKGYRTGTRRSRKQVTKNWKDGAEPVDNRGKMVEDVETTVSESEKLGVAVLGRRFSDKIEQVPIKKRRFVFRSPSPPPRSNAPPFEESGQLVDSQHSRGQVRSKSFARKLPKTTDASTTKFAHTTDFSGIEILADAACSNSISDDAVIAEGSLAEESKREVFDLSTCGVPPEETIASSVITNCSQKDMTHGERKDINVACLKNHPSDMDDGVVKKSVSLRDERLHWDLNVSMDAWEQPPETDSQATSVDAIPVDSRKGDGMQITEWCETQKEDTGHKSLSAGNPVIGGLVSSDVSEATHMSGDMKCSAPETCGSNKEVNKVESCSSLDNNRDKSAPAFGDHAQESSTEVAKNVKASVQATSKVVCSDQPPCSSSEDVTSLQMVEDCKTGVLVEQNLEVDDKRRSKYGASGFKLDGGHVMNFDVASPCEPVPEKVPCETDSSILNEVAEDTGKMLGLYNRNAQERMSTGSCPPSPATVEPASKAEELCVSPSAKSEGMSASGAPDREGLHGGTVDSDGHKDEAVVLNADKVDRPHHIESSSVEGPRSDACNKNGSSSTSSTDKFCIDDRLAGGFDSHVCQDAKRHSISMEKNEPDGYDSQFEDGELRETDMCWDNDDGEAECVDYDSDNGDAFDNDAADYSVSMAGRVDVGSECEREGICASEAEMEKITKADSSRFNVPSDNVIENGQCSEDALRESGWSEISANPTAGITEDGGMTKKHSTDCVDNVGMKDIPARAIGSKTSRREFQSSIGSRLSPDMLDRKDAVPVRRGRSDNFDDAYSRVEGMAGPDKSFGRERSTLHLRSRSPSGGHSFNPSGGFRDSKRAHSPTYYGSYSSGRPRPKSVVESRGYVMASDNGISDAVTGLDSRIRRPFINSSSNGVYRPHVRRRSPSEREDAYGMPAGMGPVRDISPDRRRFRRYPQGISRGFREEYHRQLPDDATEYSNRLPHRMTRRQRSISPPCGRVPPHYSQPFKKSRSRSRSRSPIGWLMPRNRNEGPRHRSRSPDFRSKGRIERTRMPFQRPGFEPSYEPGFISPPGNRFSPPRNSRWFDDRNCGVDHLRGRRSPVRMFRPNQRFDSGRPMRRNDDGFRPPMMHPGGRYADMPGAGRGRKYEGGEEERRKNGERYEVIQRVRRYDSDGPVRRFRYDTEDCFVAKNSNNNYDDCNRISDRRPRDAAPRRASEEKDQPRFIQDQPRSNQEQPRFNQDQPRSNQEQPRFNQDQQPRLNQEQPRFNQDSKVNNTSPKPLGVLEEEAAAA